MKAKLALLFAALFVLAAPISALSAETATPTTRFIIKDITNPKGQNGGLLNAAYTDGILLIDYNEAETKEAELVFELAMEDGTRVIRNGTVATIMDMSTGDLLDPAQEGMQIGNTATLAIQIDPSIRGLTLYLDTENGLYESKRVPVLWRETEVGPPISAQVWPGTDITIGVGQQIDLDVSLIGSFTDTRCSLGIVGYDDIVTLTGKTIHGMEEGTAIVTVLNGAGSLLLSVNVTVQKDAVEYGQPEQVEYPQYRVAVPSVKVYSLDSTQSEYMGALRMNQTVSVFADDGDWLLLCNNTWVESKYLIPLN